MEQEFGKEFENVLRTMGITCYLRNSSSNALVNKFEYDLNVLADFSKLKKACAVMSICYHKEINVSNNTNYHFALEIKKASPTLNLLEYDKQTDRLSAVIGLDSNDDPVIFNVPKSIHSLISGATGMGKTTILNNLIYSLTKKNDKKDLQLYIIDIKKTLAIWNGLPHLAQKPAHTPYDALDDLGTISKIMERRFKVLAKQGLTKATEDTFPYIVVVIDELADLMLSNLKKYIEQEITHIAQLGRAVNISLLIATQNPLVRVCTSLIKANCPTRIALKMVSIADSKNILDNKKAVELESCGDAIIRSAENSIDRKFRACYLTEEQIKQYLEEVKDNV